MPSLALSGTSTPRPSWTEQSSYILGDELYTVGVASEASTVEKGRQQAFAHGVAEIMNFAQTVDVSALVIETQMTYEEENPNSTVTVYRLLKVSLTSLLELKGKAEGGGVDSPRMREALKRLRFSVSTRLSAFWLQAQSQEGVAQCNSSGWRLLPSFFFLLSWCPPRPPLTPPRLGLPGQNNPPIFLETSCIRWEWLLKPPPLRKADNKPLLMEWRRS